MPDLTIAEAATALGVSVDTVRRRIKMRPDLPLLLSDALQRDKKLPLGKRVVLSHRGMGAILRLRRLSFAAPTPLRRSMRAVGCRAIHHTGLGRSPTLRGLARSYVGVGCSV
jgi:hypothetical protein